MEKKLILIRHAEAEEGALSDKERALTQRGIRQAYLLSEWMQQQHFLPALIVHSSARRCRETAQLLAERLNIAVLQEEERLYNASMRQIVEVLEQTPGAVESLALVGHNPYLSYFAEWVTGEPLGSLSPASAVVLSLPVDDWTMLSGQMATLLGRFDAVY
ncbi:MAG: phosphoglycerate mutase [Thermonema sp.]|jgi:phosphohistidine phosphatase|uniref:SixA phosphatase family protein n=1 Tax=Thermonema sp. TaxID=2231181 RepID=UPI0021DB8EE5|nr:histidine phosphatase family protein [Thermonema sp.]GIV38679.1 MAG: phosphoglycerate mutase [Thermonema sp.]